MDPVRWPGKQRRNRYFHEFYIGIFPGSDKYYLCLSQRQLERKILKFIRRHFGGITEYRS